MNEEKMNKIVGQKKKTALSMQGAEVQFLVAELKSHIVQGTAKKFFKRSKGKILKMD